MSDDGANIVGDGIAGYLETLNGESPQPARKMEEEARERDFPIVGPLVGRLLKLLSRTIQPRQIVEMGSGFGYSAYWFGQGYDEAVIHLTEYDEDNLAAARNYLSETDLPEQYRYHAGDAFEVVETISGQIDVVFVDIDKEDYPRALNWAEGRLQDGGWLIADNVLWQGKVLESDPEEDSTKAIRKFNEEIFSDRWESSIIPLRDGVAVCRLLESR